MSPVNRVGDENILGASQEEIICFHEQVRLIDHCVEFASVSSNPAKRDLCRLLELSFAGQISTLGDECNCCEL